MKVSTRFVPGVLLWHRLAAFRLLGGSWDLVSKVINKVTILISPIKVLITLLTKSHDPPSRAKDPSPDPKPPPDLPKSLN